MMRIYSFATVAVLAGAATACGRGPKPDAYGNIEATEVVVSAQAAGQLESFLPAEGGVLPCGATVGVIDTVTESLQLQQVSAQRTASESRATDLLAARLAYAQHRVELAQARATFLTIIGVDAP